MNIIGGALDELALYVIGGCISIVLWTAGGIYVFGWKPVLLFILFLVLLGVYNRRGDKKERVVRQRCVRRFAPNYDFIN